MTQTDVTSAPGSEGYSYDGMHRLATMNRGTQGQPDFAQAWTLDKVGNWTAFNDNGTNENRTHNALNQITVRAGNNLVYDANGNQTDDGEKFLMVYDANNRLKEVHDRVTGQAIMTCKYDAMGRRVERSVLVPAEGQTGGTTRYCYAGQRIVEEYDADNLLQAVYTYGQYIDEPLSMDHVATSQPTSQPAEQPLSQLTLSPAPSPSPAAAATPDSMPAVATPTDLALATPAATTPTNTPEPAVTPAPTNTPDVVATQIAITYATPTATPVPTITPDAMATQIALTYGTPTPDPLQTPAPTVVATALPPQSLSLAAQSTPTPSASVSSVPSVVSSSSAASQPSLQRYYYHATRLYCVAALTDDQGAVVERYRYDAYGLCTTFDAAYDNPMAFSRFGNPFTFTGKELDPESGLMRYQIRTYDPAQGRFKQRDPFESIIIQSNIGNLQHNESTKYLSLFTSEYKSNNFTKKAKYVSQLVVHSDDLNLYEYVNNSPFQYVDPTGMMRSAGQCCLDAKNAGLDYGDAGGVICCDGRMVACSWVYLPRDPEHDFEAEMIRECVTIHELTHFPDNSCTCFDVLRRPNVNLFVNINQSECRAYTKEKTCWDSYKGKCKSAPNPTVCEANMKIWKNDTNKKIAKYCGGGK